MHIASVLQIQAIVVADAAHTQPSDDANGTSARFSLSQH